MYHSLFDRLIDFPSAGWCFNPLSFLLIREISKKNEIKRPSGGGGGTLRDLNSSSSLSSIDKIRIEGEKEPKRAVIARQINLVGVD